MDDKAKVALLRRQLSAAQEAGPDPTDLERAVRYYYGRPRGDEVEGRSQVQSLDVADMVHAIMAQILPSFTQDSICQFEPDGQGDEAQARLESDAVNRVVMESSRGFLQLYSAVKDALLLKVGVVKAYLDESGPRRAIRCETVDPLDFVVGPGQCTVLLNQDFGGFCAERKRYRRSELIEMGFDRDKVARIPTGADTDSDSTVASVRNRQGIETPEQEAGWANEIVTVWECYSLLADDEDASKTRLYRCMLGGQELLLSEPADYVPYATGAGFIEPHKFWGLSIYDRLKSVQDAKTAIQRQWLDNLGNCNNARSVVNDRVSLQDYTDSRPGGAVRVEGVGPVQDSLMPLPVIDVGPAAASYLAYMDQVRADRGGAALQMASAEAQLVGGQVGSQGVDRIYSVQEALAGMIARTLAETLLRSLFLLVHRLLRTELGETLTLRYADQWVPSDPSKWRERDRVNIKSGLSPGEKSRKVAALQQVISYQWSVIQAGQDGVMVTLPNLYNAYLDWANAQELDAGEKYFTDPNSPTAARGIQVKQQQQQQMQAMQAQLAQVQLQLEQAKAQTEAQKVQLDALKADQEMRFNYWKEALHAEIEEAKLTATVTTDLAAQQSEGRRRANGSADGGGAGDR